MLRPMRPVARHPFVEDILPVDGPPDIPKPPKKASYKPVPSKPADIEQLKKDLAACDGGTGVYAKAKAANGGRDPVFRSGRSVKKTGGSTDTQTGIITVDPGFSRQENAETGIFELTNLSNKARFAKVNADVIAGKLGREQYTRESEAIEYDALKNSIKADNACKKQWGAPPGWKGTYDALTKVKIKDFDDYYKNYIADDHKNYYRHAWDKEYKAIYEAAHPPHKPPHKNP